MNFGMQSADSAQRSGSGLLPAQRSYFSGLSPQLFGETVGRVGGAYEDPGGIGFLPQVERLMPLGRYGIPLAADQGFLRLGQDLFSKASGARAARGGQSPENLEAVLGDSLSAAASTLLPMQVQTAFQRAQMAPQLRQTAFGFGVTPMQMLTNLLNAASESVGSSSSSGFGFGLG